MIVVFRMVRSSFLDSLFQVDIDHATYPDGDVPPYSIGEVEVMVESEEGAAQAATTCSCFVRDELQADGGPPVGKIEHLLRATRPAHYEALRAAGVIR